MARIEIESPVVSEFVDLVEPAVDHVVEIGGVHFVSGRCPEQSQVLPHALPLFANTVHICIYRYL